MTPEQMSNEELAEVNDLLSEYPEEPVFATIGFVNDADIRAEISRRLRNSIPKPVVDFIDDTLTVNGKYIACYDSEYAVDVYHNLRKAIGLEGGGDE